MSNDSTKGRSIEDLLANSTPEMNRLLESLKSSKSLAAMRLSLESAPERELCKRAALVRAFDRELFDAVLAAGLDLAEPDAQFDRLINRSGVERIPNTKNLYRLKDAARQEYLSAWTIDAASETDVMRAQAEFGRKLVDYFEGRSDAQLDLLSGLLLADQARAQQLFLTLYDEADSRFDLPLCQTLLRILEEHDASLNQDLRKVLSDKQCYYRTRSLFAAEYYQTVSYYPRDNIRRQFDSLLQHPSKWIFHLYATGGMGKTMFLRWLAARHCVVRPERIPVARLDFDFVHLPLVNKYPWLLLQPLAAQLNEQISGRPFYEMVESPTGLREFAPLLRQMMSEERRREAESGGESGQRQDPSWQEFYEARRKEREQAESKLQSSAAVWSTHALDRFRSALAGSGLTAPVVIILDTLEDMTITEQSALIKILEYLADIHKAYAGIRLILSGRYNLSERIPEFKELYNTQTEYLELGRFTREEAIGYLTQKRHLADRSLLAAIYERADQGNPFKLALFADMVSSKEAAGERVSSQEVLDFPDADFAYLIERIVERVAEPEVRWVLRYGAVSRRLTCEFFESVMLPHLKSEIVQSKLDRPAENWPEEARTYEGRLIWPNQSLEEERLAVVEIWRRLRHYASGYGWINHELLSDSFIFHPDVRTPMRRLLRRQEIFRPLQESAVNHFKARASEDRSQWALWASEVVYHLSQFDLKGAVQYWEEKLDAPESQFDPAARKQLAKEVIKPDYAEEAMFSPHVEAQALMTVARACVALAWDERRKSDEWNEAKRHLDLLRERHPDRVSEQESLLSQIADHLLSRRDAEAVPPIEKLLREEIGEDLRLSLELQLAELMALLKRPGAAAHYLCALDQIRDQPSSFASESAVRLKLAAYYAVNEHFADAEREYLTVLESELSEDEERTALFRLAVLNFDSEQFEKAEEYASRALGLRASHAASRFRHCHLVARTELASCDPDQALRRIQSVEPPADDSELVAMGCELRGEIHGQLMNFEQAASQLEEAKGIWDQVGNDAAQDRCRLKMAEIQLYGVGNLKETNECLMAWRLLSRHEPSETELRLELLGRTLPASTVDRTNQYGHWKDLLSLDWVKNSPRFKALTLATRLAFGLATSLDLTELLESLQQIEPEAARLAVLEPFRFWRARRMWFEPAAPPLEVAAATRDSFLELLERVAPSPEGEPGRGFVRQVLLASDVYRWLDKPSPAEKLLERAETKARDDSNRVALRALHCARDRWEQRGRTNKIILRLPVAVGDQFPMLESIILLEHAERLFRGGELSDAEGHLAIAEKLLDKNTPTQWSARAEELKGRLIFGKGNSDIALQYLVQARETYLRLDDIAGTHRASALIAEIRNQSDGQRVFDPSLKSIGESLHPDEMIEPPAYLIEFESISEDQLYLRSNLLQPIPLAPLRGPIQQWEEVHFEDPRFLQSDNIAREMGEILLSAEDLASITQREDYRAADLQLSIPPGRTSALPWELASIQSSDGDAQPLTNFFCSVSRTTRQTSPTRETVKWTQTALKRLVAPEIVIDGIYGPITHAAVGQFQRQFGLGSADGRLDRVTIFKIREALGGSMSGQPIRAIIIQSRAGFAIKGERGYSGGALDLSRIYRQHGCEALMLDNVRPEYLADLLIERRPQVLHFVGMMDESTRSGEITLNLGEELRPGLYSAKSLNSLLKRLPDDLMRPLVMIDVIRPHGLAETARQLRLRNQFATQLFHSENTGGVIGMGLGLPYDQEGILNRLVFELAQGKGLGEAVGNVRGMHLSGQGRSLRFLDEEIATQGMALFTLDPALSLIR